jgi:hypothetical protein
LRSVIEAELARLALEAEEQAERGQVIFADRDRAERRSASGSPSAAPARLPRRRRSSARRLSRALRRTNRPEVIEAELARLALEAEEQAERGQVIFADRDRAEPEHQPRETQDRPGPGRSLQIRLRGLALGERQLGTGASKRSRRR